MANNFSGDRSYCTAANNSLRQWFSIFLGPKFSSRKSIADPCGFTFTG